MTIELSGVLALLVAAASLLTLAAAATAWYKSSLGRATVQTLKENNDALMGRVTILEGENGELKGKVEALRAENVTLRSLVSAEQAVNALGQQLSEATTAILSAIQSKRAGADEAEAAMARGRAASL